MRVLMLTWECPPHIVGGLGKHVSDLVPALAAAGVDVHVVTPNLCGGAPVEHIAPNATIYRITLPDVQPGGASPVTLAQTHNVSLERKALELHVRLGGFDLIHAHDWLVAHSAVAVKYAARIPLIVTVHSTERGRGQGLLASDQAMAINSTEWWLTYEAWRLITVSQYMTGQLGHYFGIPNDKIDVVPNGVVLPPAPLPSAECRALRRRFADDHERLVFSVGRMVHEKGLHVLIDAAPQILREHPATRFVIAGTGSQLDALRQRAWERDVHRQVSFTGFIPDQDRDCLFQVADVAVFPSLYEPFGIVALEAMAHRCPVVVSATGGLAEVVRLHETGLTAHPGIADSLAWAVNETLSHPDWARQRAENAYGEVGARYNWGLIADQTRAVYGRVLRDYHQSDWAPATIGQLV